MKIKNALHRVKIRGRLSQKGYALYLSAVLILLFFVLGIGIEQIMSLRAQDNIEEQKSIQAFYFARMGLSKAVEELQKDYRWAVDEPYVYNIDKHGIKGTCTVYVGEAPKNDYSIEKIWMVVSKGNFGGRERTLTSWMKLESFAQYVYFSNREGFEDTQLWWNGSQEIHGRMHTNGFFSFSMHPIILGEVTSSNLDDPYFDFEKTAYNQEDLPHNDSGKFYHYLHSYAKDEPIPPLSAPQGFSFKGGVSEILLPEDFSQIKDNAEKIYDGDISVKFFDTGKVRVRQKRLITENYYYPYEETVEETLDNEGDLVIYAGGNITLEEGVVSGKYTLAAKGNIEIKDSVVYNDPKRDVLGVLAEENVIVNTDPYLEQDLSLHMAIMALEGSFFVKDYDKGKPRGTLELFGGVIQNIRGPAAVSTPFDIGIESGYYIKYFHDQKLFSSPPPHFPASGKIKVLSVQNSIFP